MKYEKLIFIYPFSIGSFLNAKVGLEATIEEGDNYLDCFHKLRKDVKEMADIEQGSVYDAPRVNTNFHDEFPKYHPPTDEEPKEKRIGVMVDDILSCDDLKVLETYRFIKDTNEELRSAYQQRYDELSNINNK